MPLHVVILPFSAQGHLIPALVLAHRLVIMGFNVTYVCPEYRLQQVQKQARARGCHGDIRFRSLKRSSPGTGEQNSKGHDSMELVYWVMQHWDDDKAEFHELMEELASTADAPCCIISDNLVSWAQDVANELDLPRLVIYPSPAQALAVVFHVRALLAEGKLPIKTRAEDVELVHIPGIPSPMHPQDLSTPLLDTSPRAVLDFYIRNSLRIHDAAGILCNSFADLEPDACSALTHNRQLNPNMVPFLPIGPLLPEIEPATQQDAEGACLSWLDKQPVCSVLYISFGSFARATPEQIHELALGLDASGHRFLWVLPGGESGLPHGFLARTQERGLIMHDWAPQVLVLSHPATGGFLSHCGWNSTMESICQGVPMLTMPLFGEQKGNARLIVEQLQIGLELVMNGDGLVVKEAVERAVRGVMEGEPTRKRARELKAAALRAMRCSDDDIKCFLSTSKSSPSQ